MNAQTHQKTEYPRILNWVATGLFILFTLFMTIGQNPEFLRKLQELDLFLYNGPFFFDSMKQVGGLSMYLSSFLLQFFYYPLAGSLLFLALLLAVSMLTARTFKLNGRFFPLSFIPSLALLLSLTDLGYMIYYQKIDGYVYNNILGIILALVSLRVYGKIHNAVPKALFSIAFILIGYPLFGVFALFGGFLMFCVSVKTYFETKQRRNLISSIVLLASLLLIPIVYYELVYDQIAFSNVFTAVLPYFKLNKSESLLWLPYLMLAIFYIFMVIWERKETQKMHSFLLNCIPLLIFLSCLIMAYVFSFKDRNFKTELSMQYTTEKEQWDQVLDLARKQKDEPTRLIVLNTNLALYKLGLAGDKMYHYKNGNKKTNSQRSILPVQTAGTLFYYQYGLTNFCNKWCMEAMVEYGLSPSILKPFVLSSLLNGEIALAKKNNDILLGTLFYRKWALKYQVYINHPEFISKAPEFKKILALNAYGDVLDGDYGNMEAFLKNHFAHLREVPPELAELSVLFSLETKDIELFWPRLFQWVRLNNNKRIPTHFQEAALLYEHLEHKVDLAGAPFDEAVKVNFRNYMAMVQQYGGYPEESIKQISQNLYGNTFWHYYFFIQDSKSQNKDDKEYKK